MYAYGQGVQQNFKLVYAWFSVAEIYGYLEASDGLYFVEYYLDAKVLAEAKALGINYYGLNHSGVSQKCCHHLPSN